VHSTFRIRCTQKKADGSTEVIELEVSVEDLEKPEVKKLLQDFLSHYLRDYSGVEIRVEKKSYHTQRKDFHVEALKKAAERGLVLNYDDGTVVIDRENSRIYFWPRNWSQTTASRMYIKYEDLYILLTKVKARLGLSREINSSTIITKVLEEVKTSSKTSALLKRLLKYSVVKRLLVTLLQEIVQGRITL